MTKIKMKSRKLYHTPVFDVERTVVEAKTRSLSADWALELPQDIESHFGAALFAKWSKPIGIPYSELPSYKGMKWYQHVFRWIRLKTGFYTFGDHLSEMLSNEITKEIDKEIMENVMADMAKFRKPE
jgi:hypothetical protein